MSAATPNAGHGLVGGGRPCSRPQRGQSITPRQVEGTTRSPLDPGGPATGRRATTGTERARPKGRCGLRGRSSPRAIVGGEAGSRTPLAKADGWTGTPPAERSPRGEERPGEPQPGDRRHDTVQAHAASAGGATHRRRDGRRTGEEAHRRKADGKHDSGRLAAPLETAGPAATDRPARTCASSSDGVGGKPEHDREVVAGDERQEGSRPQRCGTAADEEQTFAGWERQRGRRTRPEKLRLRRPIRPKPGEPGPGTGCNMPGAVNGGSRRGGEKPRGRSETGGLAAIGRGEVLRNRPGVDVHGDIGRRAHQQGTKFQERKEPRAAR